LVRPTGFEPATFGVGVLIKSFYDVPYCSINRIIMLFVNAIISLCSLI
jgi:hypothetical protein